MTEQRNRVNVGIPVQWMVDPADPETVLGVIYEFSLTKDKKTVWYTPDGRPLDNIRVIRRREFYESGG